MRVSAVLILLLVLRAGNALNNKNCIKTYQELERSVIQRQSNMDNMVSAFFPPNRQASIAANVYYFFDDQNMSLNAENLDITSYDYAFRWSASPVFNIMRPELLHYLSLFVYHGDTTMIQLIIDPLCEVPPLNRRLVDEQACSGGESATDAVLLLNQLTTNLKSFVMDNRLLGMDEKSRGYSSYFFNRNNTKDHCIIGQANLIRNIRIGMGVFLIILPFIIAIGFPAVVVSSRVRKWFTKEDSDVWYYAWATVITITLLDVAIFCIDIPIIILGFHDNTTFTDVIVYYSAGVFFLTVFPFLNFGSAYRQVRKRSKDSTTFCSQDTPKESKDSTTCCSQDTPEESKDSTTCCSQDTPEESKDSTTCCSRETLIQCTLTTVAVFAVQLISHHSYYIILAIIASPVHSLSFLFLYATGIFCAMNLGIIIVKLHSKKSLGIPECIVLGILSVVVIISVIYVITTLMSLVGKHQDSGVVAVVTEIIWSVVLLLLGYCGNKVSSWLG